MKVSAALPAGVTALFFDAARRRRRLEGRLVEGLEAAGYGEVVLPILDYLEPYEDLLAPESRGELYRFVDRDGELLALRADFTPMLARLLAPRLGSLEPPLRLFYRGDVVRWQEERAGRLREFYQVGAELLGAAGAAGDREMLELFLGLLAGSGAPGLQVVLGFAGALDAVLLETAGEGGAGELARAVAQRDRRRARQASPALARVVETGLPGEPGELGAEAALGLETLQDLAAELAVRFPGVALAVDLAEFAETVRDPRLAGMAGRRYYDGLLFRAYVGSRALPVGDGGRYDQLYHRLGVRLPAVGFSLGLDRLLEAVSGSRARAVGVEAAR